MSLNTATAENRSKLGRLDNYLPVYSGDVNPMVSQLNNMGNYKSYVAILTQSDTDAPVVNVLQNGIGAGNWERTAKGEYRVPFTAKGTVYICGSSNYIGSGVMIPVAAGETVDPTTVNGYYSAWEYNGYIYLATYDSDIVTEEFNVVFDGSNLFLPEIRIYN